MKIRELYSDVLGGDLHHKYKAVLGTDSPVRYRESDFNETVYIRGDGCSSPATPEEIISPGKRKYGVCSETSGRTYREEEWKEYIKLSREYRKDSSFPDIKELQSEGIVSPDGSAKSGFVMFADDYDGDDSLICCRLWKGMNKTGTVLDSERLKGFLASVLRE